MHKSPTELAQNAQRRMATALRLGATLDAGPRSTCALWKSNDGDMCEHSLATTRSAANTGGARARPHRAVQHTLCRLIEQAGSPRFGEKQQRSSTRDAVRHLRRCFLVSRRPATTLDRRQRAMPARRTLQRKCVETRVAAVAGEAEKRSAVEWPCERWSSRLMEDWAVRAPSCCLILVTTAAGDGQRSPNAVGRWRRTQLERVLLNAQADTHLRALGSRVAERPAAEPLLLLAE